MASKIINTGLKRTALSVALGMCFAGSVLAQSNSTGSIAGTTDAGATVTVENPANGFKREITAGSDGQYRISSLPTGTYKVTTKGQTRDVAVTIGGTATGSTTNLDAVNVVGGGTINAIDVSSVESTTILTAAQIAKIPVARDITNVALLAPGTVRGDAAFGRLASFGGSSVSENAYFVNGFNITNAFKNLAFANVPFEAISEQQVKTGGYGAEFGRSLGGVINLVTKRGSNEFHAGANVFVEPESLSSSNPDVIYSNGVRVSDNSQDKGHVTTGAVWASGAIVQDRLFFYALAQYERGGSDAFPGTTVGFGPGTANANFSNKSPTWVAKLDWNINDNHSLEFTAFSDKDKNEDDYYRTHFGVDPIVGTGTVANPQFPAHISQYPQRGDYLGTNFNETGGTNYVLKYTGYLTDNFTLSALYGDGKYKRTNYAVTANGTVERYAGNLFGPVAGCPTVTDTRTVLGGPGGASRITGCGFVGALGRPDSQDHRKQFRVDADWQLGDHLLKFGFDYDEFSSVDGSADEGGVRYGYSTYRGTDVVRVQYIRQGASVKVKQPAYYVQDAWNITDNFVGYLGLRWDTFDNQNGSGVSYVKIKNQFSPRLGFSWDVNGDQKFKVFGNAGRYALPLTATVAIRGGGTASRFERQDYTYTGVNPDGSPIGLTPIPVTDTRCSENAGSGSRLCTQTFINNEFGQAKTDTFASENLKPQYQDEYILGFQAQLTDNISGGVRGIYRNLKAAIDDTCAYDVFGIDEAAKQGLPYNPVNTGFSFCHIWNPGSDLIIKGDLDGNGTLEDIHIAGNLLAPKAKRTYKAVEFFAEGQWDKFFLQGSYTWAQSYGNTEGGVKSDIGQDDTGTTQDFDKLQLTTGSEGFLPNDRRHSFKLFGNYEINDQWSVGANILVQSGRPINCLGVFENDPVGYGAGYFSCGGFSQIVPRGTAGRTPWTRSLDMNVAWKPAFADQKLTFKADIFNIFNERQPIAVSEVGEDAGNNSLDTGISTATSSYKSPTSFQAPRSVRLMVQYDW